jgi:hypothetical protein
MAPGRWPVNFLPGIWKSHSFFNECRVLLGSIVGFESGDTSIRRGAIVGYEPNPLMDIKDYQGRAGRI